jgi:hypothetical protein
MLLPHMMPQNPVRVLVFYFVPFVCWVWVWMERSRHTIASRRGWG